METGNWSKLEKRALFEVAEHNRRSERKWWHLKVQSRDSYCEKYSSMSKQGDINRCAKYHDIVLVGKKFRRTDQKGAIINQRLVKTVIIVTLMIDGVVY